MHTASPSFLAQIGAIFVARHWVFGLLNLLLTAFLGVGLLRLAANFGILRRDSTAFVQLKRFVLLCALAKGAFYLVQGDSRGFHPVDIRVSWGLQLPDPRETLFIAHQSLYSIWHPTRLTFYVTALLTGLALALLLQRLWKLARAARTLELMARLSGLTPSPPLHATFLRAAQAVGLSEKARLPQLTLVNLPEPTPLLVGIVRPHVLLSPRLVAMLSDEELELALRHELAHFRRRDHWWRCLQAWVEDVGRLTLVSSVVGALAIDQEEILCDQMAVQSAQDAVWLSRAITKAASITQHATAKTTALLSETAIVHLPASHSPAFSSLSANVPSATKDADSAAQKAVALPSYVIPSLLGRHWAREWTPHLLSQRLNFLLTVAQEQTPAAQSAARSKSPAGLLSSLRRCASWLMRAMLTVLLFALLILTLCLRFRLLFNLPGIL